MTHPDQRYQTISNIIQNNYKKIRQIILNHDIKDPQLIIFKSDPGCEHSKTINTIDTDIYPFYYIFKDESILCIEHLHINNIEFVFYKHISNITGVPKIEGFYEQYYNELYFDAYDLGAQEYYIFREEIKPYLDEIVIWFQEMAIEFL